LQQRSHSGFLAPSLRDRSVTRPGAPLGPRVRHGLSFFGRSSPSISNCSLMEAPSTWLNLIIAPPATHADQPSPRAREKPGREALDMKCSASFVRVPSKAAPQLRSVPLLIFMEPFPNRGTHPHCKADAGGNIRLFGGRAGTPIHTLVHRWRSVPSMSRLAEVC
jgi:hypothetical protein